MNHALRLLALLSCLVLALPIVGCGHGVDFRMRDVVPDFQRGNAEWRGLLVEGTTYHPARDKDCFKTKRSETSPGSVLACSGNPKIRALMREIVFRDDPGAKPTMVRFSYYPEGGDQERAIGPELRIELLEHLDSLRNGNIQESHTACRDTVSALDLLLHRIADMAPEDRHHGDIADSAMLGSEAAGEYFREYPDEQPGCRSEADALAKLIEEAPLSGYLEIAGSLTWDR